MGLVVSTGKDGEQIVTEEEEEEEESDRERENHAERD
jgi:hypothetical protein